MSSHRVQCKRKAAVASISFPPPFFFGGGGGGVGEGGWGGGGGGGGGLGGGEGGGGGGGSGEDKYKQCVLLLFPCFSVNRMWPCRFKGHKLRVNGKYSRCVALYSSSLKQCAYYGMNRDLLQCILIWWIILQRLSHLDSQDFFLLNMLYSYRAQCELKRGTPSSKCLHIQSQNMPMFWGGRACPVNLHRAL